MTWGIMVLAILLEAGATASLRQSDGLSRPPWVFASVLGYVSTFALVSVVLERGWTLAFTYGVWSAGGILLLAAVDHLLFDNAMTWTTVAGMCLAIAGILLMQHGTAHGAPST